MASTNSMKTLYLDIFSGISGDMFLGAMVDLGVDAKKLEAELLKLDLGDDWHLHNRRAGKANIAGVKFDVHGPHCHDHEHGKSHEHEHAHSHEHSHGDLAHSHEHTHGHSHEHGHDHDHTGHAHEHGGQHHDHLEGASHG